MGAPRLNRLSAHGVTFLGDAGRPSGVAFAFTERTGGVSGGPWSSLNLGAFCGDDPGHVRENRRRALYALGAAGLLGRLVSPRQVHGDHVVVVSSATDAAVSLAQAEAEAGADAIVCCARGVPVLLCFADCVPVVLVSQGGFAVVHSGWRGTLAEVSATAARVLAEVSGSGFEGICAYLGPHIGAEDYEVSEELLGRFVEKFGDVVCAGERRLNLGAAIVASLERAGLARQNVLGCTASTVRCPKRFFSYRAQGGTCGRHGALAVRGPWEEDEAA